MIPNFNKRIIIFFILLVLVTSIPYFVAIRSQNNEYIFAGFVFNPLDNNSYLAKMYEGWAGSWKFTLPFTSDPGEGQPLFLFYLFLGHLSRVVHIPLIWMFHVARWLCGFLMFTALWKLCNYVFHNDTDMAWNTFLLASLGAGMGWFFAPLGYLFPDLWVAEAFPFLSFYANPHFPLGLAILIFEIYLYQHPLSFWKGIWMFLSGIILAIVMPFGVVVLFVVLSIQSIWGWYSSRAVKWKAYILANLGGGVVLCYEYWVTINNVQLVEWNRQNITQSPSIIETILALSPVIILALWGIFTSRENRHSPYKFLIGWLLGVLVLLYVPVNLQRRFMMGLYVPAAILGMLAIKKLVDTKQKFNRLFWPGVLAISVITNLFIIVACCFGALALDPLLFLHQNEITAFTWIQSNTHSHSVILASPQTSMFIPGRTGRQVTNGHPFETINAVWEKDKVEAFYSGQLSSVEMQEYIKAHDVSYIFYGDREKELSNNSEGIPLLPYPIVYQNDGVRIFYVPVYEK